MVLSNCNILHNGHCNSRLLLLRFGRFTRLSAILGIIVLSIRDEGVLEVAHSTLWNLRILLSKALGCSEPNYT